MSNGPSTAEALLERQCDGRDSTGVENFPSVLRASNMASNGGSFGQTSPWIKWCMRAYSAFLIECIETASVMVSTRPEVPPVIRLRKLKKDIRTTETELLIKRRRTMRMQSTRHGGNKGKST
jgi:hypothetical protein